MQQLETSRRYENETPAQLTERLKQSIEKSIAEMTPEKALELLSGLSSYDQNGKLKETFQ